jgi:hypothetical protein
MMVSTMGMIEMIKILCSSEQTGITSTLAELYTPRATLASETGKSRPTFWLAFVRLMHNTHTISQARKLCMHFARAVCVDKYAAAPECDILHVVAM